MFPPFEVSDDQKVEPKRVARWYFGGPGSAGAAFFTHPLELLKVHLQTQQTGKLALVNMTKKIVKQDGFFGLYNGLSAALLRTLLYTGTRFGIYDVTKQAATRDNERLSFSKRVAIAAISGACGGFLGTPADVVNVRMQNDMKLSPSERRLYKHAFDGLTRVYKEEGIKRLFGGATMTVIRAILMTVGQISFYDQIKVTLLDTPYFEDNLATHFTASCAAGFIATTLTQPFDVMKTRIMNAETGQFKNMAEVFLYTAKLGPLGFFKGYIPAFVRLVPHTILTFVFYEQIRLRFGHVK